MFYGAVMRSALARELLVHVKRTEPLFLGDWAVRKRLEFLP